MRRLTIKETKNLISQHGIDVHESVIRRWCSIGKLKALKLGKNWWIDRDSVLRILGQQVIPATR